MLAGELEVLLGPSDGRLVCALAVPVATLPLARRRDLPLLPLAAVVVALLAQVLFGDFFDGGNIATLVAMVIALYSAGRHAAGAWALAAAAATAALLAGIRIAFDPAVDDVGAAALTVIAVAMPLLIGRWVDGQVRLHRELETTSRRRERERERDARDAAEEERMRIAADLQAAVADRLGTLVEQAGTLRRRLAADDEPGARELLAGIAGSAREALADVRRVLGILRRDDQAPRLEPPARPAAAIVPAPAAAASAAPGADSAPAPARDAWLRHPRTWSARQVDRLLVLAVLACAALELQLSAAPGDRAFAALSAVTIAVPLLWRRRYPIPVALAILGAVGLQSAVLQLDSFPGSDAVALICASYAIAAHSPRRAGDPRTRAVRDRRRDPRRDRLSRRGADRAVRLRRGPVDRRADRARAAPAGVRGARAGHAGRARARARRPRRGDRGAHARRPRAARRGRAQHQRDRDPGRRRRGRA